MLSVPEGTRASHPAMSAEADPPSLTKTLNFLIGVHREHKDAPLGSRAIPYRATNEEAANSAYFRLHNV